ncbi:F-BOX WITH WD-40 2 [Prunus dulcis]|uniref:F-BOX WITH WD-40 2 n=1 Tax=Prunus dulcis TaxID=3755 RepID=A0A5H2Y6S8_PRUDU|nr:F-BOX WITH WD-40 2 [Prunus dulcis]
MRFNCAPLLHIYGDQHIEHYANEIHACTKKVLKYFYEDYPLDTLRIFRKYIGADIGPTCLLELLPREMDERKWEDLQMDCLVKVLVKVGMESLLLDVPFVCKSWYKATLNPSCWQSLIFPDNECIEVWPGDASECPNFKNLMDRFASEYQIDGDRCSVTGFVHEREALSIVKLVPNIKYLNLKGAKVSRDSLVTLLCGCKDLVMLDARDCFGFDENDDELSKLASHISKFMCEGSEFPEFLRGMDNVVILPDVGYSFQQLVENWDEMLNDLRDAFNDLSDEERRTI